MLNIKLINVETQESFDLICEEYKMLSNVTKFEHATNHYQLNVDNYSYTTEDDTFTPLSLQFNAIPRTGEEVEEFKRFFRKENSTFIMKIQKSGKTRYVYCKRKKGSVIQIYSTEIERYNIEITTLTHFIEFSSHYFILENEIPEGGYSSSNPPSNDGYIYPFTYAQTLNSIGFFPVPIEKNNGDKKMYINVTMIDYEDDPKFAINQLWSDTDRAYAADGITAIENDLLIVNSFPVNKKIVLKSGSNELNVEQLRDFSKITYLTINPDEEVNIIFTNVREGNIQLYKQFVLPD